MRIAVLGCGSIGRRHLRNLQSLGYSDLLAFDPVLEVCRGVENELGVLSFAVLDEVWTRRPDIVLVTAPTNVHIELALEAARRGCQLFIEKPLSHSFDGLNELRVEVEQHNLITMVGCNMRFHSGPATVKKLIEEEMVGEVIAARIQTGSYLPRWRLGQDYRESYSASPAWGGATLDCIHEIDLALWYFGSADVVGAAHLPASRIGLKTDGLAEILLHHKSGVLSNIHLNFVQRDYHRSCQIIGTRGTVYWDFTDHQVTVYGEDGELPRSIPQPEDWRVNQMYVAELSHFLQAVANQEETINPVSGGVAALEVALAVRERRWRIDS